MVKVDDLKTEVELYWELYWKTEELYWDYLQTQQPLLTFIDIIKNEVAHKIKDVAIIAKFAERQSRYWF